MSHGFWETVRKPIIALAPMADVTDAAFRRVIAARDKPDVMWTEFVSADGLMLADEAGKEKLKKDLIFTEIERPIVAQFFSAKPQMMRKAAELAAELGFDGIDINMGCPDRSIEKQGAGAALIKTPKLALELITAAKQGAGGMPVSVKTRIGYNSDEIDTWVPRLLSVEPAALTVHLRTRVEMSKVPARWELASRVVAHRDTMGAHTLIIGNGDVKDTPEARAKARASGVDGVMLGRAIFGNPWLFSSHVPTVEEKLRVLIEHTKLFEALLGGTKNFAIMKKHYKAYVNDFDGAKELRVKLMEAINANEVERLVEGHLKMV